MKNVEEIKSGKTVTTACDVEMIWENGRYQFEHRVGVLRVPKRTHIEIHSLYQKRKKT